MRIGILQSGHPPRELQGRFGLYGAMFETLLGQDAFDWRVYDLKEGEFPERPEDNAGYVITGSAAGVYDPDPWIGRARQFLKDAKGKAALVGVCFGHQLMAEAFGGKVIKSPKGWGIGLHHYDIAAHRPWMGQARTLAAAASHQDQVVEAPPHTTVLAASEFTPLGMLAYDDQPAISIQLHPEFDPDYARALIEVRRERYAPGAAEAALESYAAPDDRARLGRWFARFLAG